MADGQLIVVTGIMAAGKSTVAQALAERFPRSAHVRGDHYRRSIVSGRHEMSAEPTVEALDQLRLRYRLAIATAEAYCRAGFTSVLQDVIIGPMLDEVVALVPRRPFSLVVLAPQADEVAERERQRPKTGYLGFTPAQLDSLLRTATPRLGYWLDSTGLTVDQTVDLALANLDTAARIA
ncbi:MAG: AAA family ATPase [Acidimicrobiales bacterium]